MSRSKKPPLIIPKPGEKVALEDLPPDYVIRTLNRAQLVALIDHLKAREVPSATNEVVALQKMSDATLRKFNTQIMAHLDDPDVMDNLIRIAFGEPGSVHSCTFVDPDTGMRCGMASGPRFDGIPCPGATPVDENGDPLMDEDGEPIPIAVRAHKVRATKNPDRVWAQQLMNMVWGTQDKLSQDEARFVGLVMEVVERVFDETNMLETMEERRRKFADGVRKEFTSLGEQARDE